MTAVELIITIEKVVFLPKIFLDMDKKDNRHELKVPVAQQKHHLYDL